MPRFAGHNKGGGGMEQRGRSARRSMLRWLTAAALTPLLGWAGQAFAKIAKKQLKYQDKPNKGQHCSQCTQFIAAKDPKARGTCKLVEGSISPNGWCLEWEA